MKFESKNALAAVLEFVVSACSPVVVTLLNESVDVLCAFYFRQSVA